MKNHILTQTISIVALSFLCNAALAAPTSTSSSTRFSSPMGKEVVKQLALPENKIDVGIAALTFAKEIYPDIDIAAYSAKIDELAIGAKQSIDRYGKYDSDSVIRAINSYFYKVYGIEYDKSPMGRATQGNYFLNVTLDTKKGQCVTIPLLYIAVAQRLGYPVYPVIAPEHNFARFVDPALKEQNIELSGSAGYSSDEDYAFKLNISKKAIKSGAYLRTLSYHYYLAAMLQQSAIVFADRGDINKAIAYFDKAYKIDPKNVYFPKNLQSLWKRKAEQAPSPELAQEFREKAYGYYLKAEEMGWTHDPDANTKKGKEK